MYLVKNQSTNGTHHTMSDEVQVPGRASACFGLHTMNGLSARTLGGLHVEVLVRSHNEPDNEPAVVFVIGLKGPDHSNEPPFPGAPASIWTTGPTSDELGTGGPYVCSHIDESSGRVRFDCLTDPQFWCILPSSIMPGCG